MLLKFLFSLLLVFLSQKSAGGGRWEVGIARKSPGTFCLNKLVFESFSVLNCCLLLIFLFVFV